MSDSTADMIVPILQSIQAQLGDIRIQLGDLRTRLDNLEGRLDSLEGRFAAFAEMTSARFTTVENMLVDLSARTHVLSSRVGKLEA